MAVDASPRGAPKRSARTASGAPGSTRVLTHTWSVVSPHRVKTLTLSPALVIASKWANSASHARPSKTRWRTS